MLEAIKQKYCPNDDEVGVDKNALPIHKPVKETATVYRPGIIKFAVIIKGALFTISHTQEAGQ